MKQLIAVLVLGAFLMPGVASAKSSPGGTHFKNNPPYDCSVTKKPSTPKWLTGTKKEKPNDKQVTLTWDDSDRAHDVVIKYWYSGSSVKEKKTGDDSREKMKKLKNGKLYSFQVRGYSNCGKSGWSKVFKMTP